MIGLNSALLALLLVGQTTTPRVEPEAKSEPAELAARFRSRLDRPRVPLDLQVESTTKEADGYLTEHLNFASERHANGRMERVPALVVKPKGSQGRLPVVIVLHGTGGNKERMRPWLLELAERGIIGVAIDARYHGARAGGRSGATAYHEAIIRAWRSPQGEAQEHPFYYDTCWDLWRTLDYLETREDVDASRMGMIGISMGGIQTWLAGAVDRRVAVAVPAIAVQSFKWSLEHDAWHARARTIGPAHQAAADDLGEPRVNERVCQFLWDKIVPGIRAEFDCPNLLPLFADRPLLILNGDQDPNCPIEGARIAIDSAKRAYQAAGVPERLRVMVAEGVGHAVTEEQHRAALDWFTRWLKPRAAAPVP